MRACPSNGQKSRCSFISLLQVGHCFIFPTPSTGKRSPKRFLSYNRHVEVSIIAGFRDRLEKPQRHRYTESILLLALYIGVSVAKRFEDNHKPRLTKTGEGRTQALSFLPRGPVSRGIRSKRSGAATAFAPGLSEQASGH